MAVDRAKLSKFIKQTELIIESVEEDNSENSKIFKLTLAQPVKAVGSNVTPEGQAMTIPQATEVYVHEEDHAAFMEGCEEGDGDTLIYKGPLKLDVSKPNGRTVNNQFVVTKPAKAWLTSVAFSKRGASLRQDRQQNLSTALRQIFGGGDQATTTAPPIGGLKDLKPVDTSNKGNQPKPAGVGGGN